MQLASLLQQTEFDYETTRLITTAFDDVWSIMETAGGPLVADGHAILTRTILAQHIIDMAMQGERDFDRLVYSALERLTGGVPEVHGPEPPACQRIESHRCVGGVGSWLGGNRRAGRQR